MLTKRVQRYKMKDYEKETKKMLRVSIKSSITLWRRTAVRLYDYKLLPYFSNHCWAFS